MLKNAKFFITRNVLFSEQGVINTNLKDTTNLSKFDELRESEYIDFDTNPATEKVNHSSQTSSLSSN